VRELYQKLRAETWIEPWLDEEELYPGQDWNMEIEKAVEAADAIIVCLSKGSITKEGYVQRELRTVLDFADYKPEGTLYIIPVRLEDCDPPRRLRAWQYADYFEGQRERAFQRLLVSLKRRADGLGLISEEVEPKQIEEQEKTPTPEIKKSEEQEEPVPLSPRENGRDVGRPREEPKQETPFSPLEVKEPEVKFTEQKPFTKLLEPSALSPKQTPPVGRVSNPTESIAPKKRQAKSLTYGFLGIGLLILLLGGFGLNYLINNLPVATIMATPIKTVTSEPPTSFAEDTTTPESPTLTTSTSVPFTTTPQPTNAPPTNPVVGSTWTQTIGGMTLLYVPAGEFTMGSENGEDDEKPVHTVYLDAFWIDQTEVTNKQYQACVDAGTCEPPSDTSSYTHPGYYGNPEFDNYPVVYVNWDKANRYCEVWTGGDLPTEAQWEKAARGTDERTYPWGNDASNKIF
jgi:hypothetical protein